MEQNETGFVYQDIKLKDFESSKAALEKLFVDMVRKICSAVKSRLEDLRRNHICENLIPILDIENCQMMLTFYLRMGRVVLMK